MAVTGQPRARDFVALKLRLVRNGLRGQGWRIALFVLGAWFALVGAALGFSLFVASGTVRGETGLPVVAIGGAAITLGWLLLPLLFFGVDDTVDPARFALLPISRARLLRGMLAAAGVGIPALATTAALTGLVVAGAIAGGAPAAGVAVAGGALALALCIVGSRALTSAFAAMLRSRRTRDLSLILITLLAAAAAPAQLAITSLVAGAGTERVLSLARVLAWTPLAAPYVAHRDAAAGHWGTAAARLLVAAVTVALLLRWWAGTIESAMIGRTAVATPGRRPAAGSATAALLPPLARRLSAPAAALVAREWRYWWREPRRRAGLLSLIVTGFVITILLGTGTHRAAAPFAAAVSATFAAMLLANQFGTDGTGYALHLLVGVRGRVELRARAVALAAVAAPVLAAANIAVAVIAGTGGRLPLAFGAAAAGLGAGLGVATVLSVVAPYPMPESPNPFAANATGGARALLAVVMMVGAMMAVAPVLALAWSPIPGWIVLPIGLAWGTGALVLGTHVGGAILDRRGPEVLAAVTPRG